MNGSVKSAVARLFPIALPLVLLGAACAEGDGVPGLVAPEDSSSAVPADAPSSLVVSPFLSFPYDELGGEPPSAILTVTNPGDEDAAEGLVVDFGSTLSVEGSLAPLAAHEVRELLLRSRESPVEHRLWSVRGSVQTGASIAPVWVSGVVATPDLPAPDWVRDAWGTTAIVKLPSAPFPDGVASYDDASVLIALPAGFADNGAVGVVTHLHGHNATLVEVAAEQSLREQFSLSGRNAVLIVPQGPEEAADSDFGKLDGEGGLYDLVVDVLSVLYRDGLAVRVGIAGTVLTSHSGGYNALANMILGGGVDISAVHLFDSLYAREAVYADFIRDGGGFRSVYTAGGGTGDTNASLAADLLAEGYAIGDAFADGDLAANARTIGFSAASHGGCVSEDRAFGRWLAASGLPPASGAPPELLATTLLDDRVTVRWRADAGDERTVLVESSADGATWKTSATTTDSHVDIEPSPWIRIRATDPTWGDSAPGDRYGATGSDWLIVDGFDRVLDGSWSEPTHEFAALVGNSLGAEFSVASNEAVGEGAVLLGNYPHVLWLLGDESTGDQPFSPVEMEAVTGYVDGGGSIVVSGSEVGWASEDGWLASTLHAALVADDAGTLSIGEWTVGDLYPEEYPDVLDGEQVIWRWDTGGAAAVGWQARVVVVGFGVENLNDRERGEALAALREFVGG